MDKSKYAKEFEIMGKYFSKDNLLSLATMNGAYPSVRCIDAYFENGYFYAITYALSNKMNQIDINPNVGICSSDWLTGHATAKNLGYIYNEENLEIAEKLKVAFAAWYDNGHNNYQDKNTVILQLEVNDCVFYHEGKPCALNFS